MEPLPDCKYAALQTQLCRSCQVSLRTQTKLKRFLVAGSITIQYLFFRKYRFYSHKQSSELATAGGAWVKGGSAEAIKGHLMIISTTKIEFSKDI